jgi:putative DNA primase/helicase
VWIYEHAELDSFSRARDVERIMAYLSSSKDHYRKSYGHRAEDVPRQSVFAGSTNKNEYLGDGTNGLNRRMWPVPCTSIDVPLIIDNRDQLWAEAVAMFNRHERWWLPNEVKAAHAELAQNRNAPDPWIEKVATLEPREHTMGDVLLHCGVEPSKRSILDERRMSPMLRAAGWTPHRVKRNGIDIRYWVPSSFGTKT